MGCCASKPFEFPLISVANSTVPSSPPTDGSYTEIRLIPEQGFFSRFVALYLPGDTDGRPSFYIGNAFLSNPFFRNNFNETTGENVPVEEMKIRNFRNTKERPKPTNLKPSNLPSSQRVEIVTRDGFAVSMYKQIDHMSAKSDVVGLDKNYDVIKDKPERTKLTLKGKVVGYMYDNEIEAMKEVAMLTDRKRYISHLRAPVVMYVSKNMSEIEMLRTVAILAAANNRLILCALRDNEHSSGIGGPS